MTKTIAFLFIWLLSLQAYAVRGGYIMPADLAISQMTVQLVPSDGSGCTGVFVGRNTILTAAHCAPGFTGEIGLQFFEGSERSILIWVNQANYRFISHPKYASEKKGALKHYDLAIVKIRDGILPEGHQIATIAKSDDVTALKEGAPVYTLGSGTNGNREHAGLLYAAPGHILEYSAPNSVIITYKSSMICMGDSGGPTFIKSKDEYHLLAISSQVPIANKKFGCGAPLEGIAIHKNNLSWILSKVDQESSR